MAGLHVQRLVQIYVDVAQSGGLLLTVVVEYEKYESKRKYVYSAKLVIGKQTQQGTEAQQYQIRS